MNENDILKMLRKGGIRAFSSARNPLYLNAGILMLVVGALILIILLLSPPSPGVTPLSSAAARVFCIFLMVLGAGRIYLSLKKTVPTGAPDTEDPAYSEFRARYGDDYKNIERQILAEADAPDSFQSTYLLLTKSYLIVKNCAYSQMWEVKYATEGVRANHPMYTIMRLDDIVYGRYIWDLVELPGPKQGRRPRPPKKGPVLILYDRHGQRLRYEQYDEYSERDFPVRELIYMLKNRCLQADIITDCIENHTEVKDVIVFDYQKLF